MAETDVSDQTRAAFDTLRRAGRYSPVSVKLEKCRKFDGFDQVIIYVSGSFTGRKKARL
ncbi:hypothetical protein WN55_03751 [Dufourea novaeangliae]|uniref:Uncharacterized protein n=1 Tax=Dufourea novaeangliae TaxID=178035 RepID=A0A154PKE7_DUFNO|nr:hypothetical protein WN55_03751 [Dufourea novaeangliae]